MLSKENMNVLINVIGAVESGGQVYGRRRYDCYCGPYHSTPTEYTITLGWPQYYGPEAKRLIQLIKDINPANFRNLDPDGIINAMLNKDWVAIRWNPSAAQKAILIKLIGSAAGHEAQDKLFSELMEKFVSDCERDYTKDPKAVMMYCEIRHLGGKGPADRIFKRCKGNYSLTNIMNALNQDDPNSNQVGSRKFRSRHQKCIEFIEKYAKTEIPGYDINKVIATAESWVGYIEKRNGDLTYLKSKTANAGSNNYTWFGYIMNKVYPATMDYPAAWCDAFVDFCFYDSYGATAAKFLLCGGFDDFTVNSADKFKHAGQWHRTDPQRGDQIFFQNDERICHTGIVYAVDASRVYTIEGNTGTGAEVIPNGGAVCKKSYLLNNSRIAGYGRPAYGNQEGGVYMFSVKTIKEGDKGADVAFLQKLLIGSGYTQENGKPLTVTSRFGSQTTYATKKFQKDKGLTVDGIAGPKTFEKLTGL